MAADIPDLSPLDYHVLLALAGGAGYGYAVAQAVEEESGGRVRPRAGSLYRVLARLMGAGLVQEEESPRDVESHPGRPRRYYGLTPEGRRALADEARRMKEAAALAELRLRPGSS